MSIETKLTEEQTENLLDAVENFIAITSVVKAHGFKNPADWGTFVEYRDRLHGLWAEAQAYLDFIDCDDEED